MLKLCGVNKTYRHQGNLVPVLQDVNIEVAQGEIFGIIGKSGAGKSTLLKCLNLLEKPDSGQIIVDGQDLLQLSISELRKVRQKIGVIFQNFNLLDSQSVFANVALPLKLQGLYDKDLIKERVDNLLELVGLQDFANKYPSSLSGGQKQRVGIARALASEPKILLSDEATSALDAQTTASILDLLLSINQKLGLTIVLITHEIDVVRKICDTVAVIDHGKIVECNKTPNIILHPQHELTRKLIVEEEALKYLEQVQDFYKFEKKASNSLIIVSYMGNQTFEPMLSKISQEVGVVFTILRGELGRIKNIPFGQMLLEVSGSSEELQQTFAILDTLKLHYEIIH